MKEGIADHCRMAHHPVKVRGNKRSATQLFGPENLKRFKSAIHHLSKDTDAGDIPDEPADIEKGGEMKPKKSRKDQRKEARVLKGMRRNAYHQHKVLPTLDSLAKEKEELEKKEEKRKKEKVKRRQKRQRKREKKREKEEEEHEACMAYENANREDDKMIRELEKQLHLKKKKTPGKLPQSFVNDGLDYLLDAVDGEKLKALYEGGAGGEEDNDGEIQLQVSLAQEEGEDSDDNDQIEAEDDNLEKFYTDDDDDDDESGDDLRKEAKKNQIINEILAAAKAKSVDVKSAIKAIKNKKKTVSFEDVDDEGDDVGSEDGKDDNYEKDCDEGDDDEDESQEDSGQEASDIENVEIELSEKLPKKKAKATGDISDDEDIGDGELSDTATGDYGSDGGSDEDGDSEGQYKEDIYGRLRDKEGNVVAAPASGVSAGSYVPPGRRLALASSGDDKKREELERLKKQLKGLVNRLSESNLQAISTQIEALYRTHSRAALSETMAAVVMEACITHSPVPERLIMEHAMLIATLHYNVGNEVGAVVLQQLAQRLDGLYREAEYGEGRQMENTLVLLANLYNFHCVHSLLVFDVLKLFLDKFGQRDIALLLLLLRNLGFSLRKDDPARLKDVIVAAQGKAAGADITGFEDPSRLKFMLEVLMALRNNNMRKIPNYDPAHLEHLRKLLRSYTRGSVSCESALRISLEDLLAADERGHWWLVGSAWSGRHTDMEPATGAAPLAQGDQDQVTAEVMELARQQRMNTDVRRNIFSIIMTCEDFVDAFERLLRLGLKQQAEREIVHVCADVCLQERAYNPFYAVLLHKFCVYHRRFKMTLQFAVWDKLKTVDDLAKHSRVNLARLLAALIASTALTLAVFKVVEWGALSRAKRLLLKRAVTSLLMDYATDDVTAAFTVVRDAPQLVTLREGLALFLSLLTTGGGPTAGKGPAAGTSELAARVALAQRALGIQADLRL